MTLTKVMQLALRRIGLDEDASAFQDNARDYFNLGAKDLSTRRAWRWLFKNSTITTVASTRTYSLASDVMRPLGFYNVTDNLIMVMRDAETADRLDPNQDDSSGEPKLVSVTGINSSTGYWEVELFPLPDDSTTSIRYRYFGYILDKTSSDDATDLAATLPSWAQLALIHYISSMYKGELGDIEGERDEYQLYEQAIVNALKVDGEAEAGNRVDRLPRNSSNGNINADFNFYINEGSLT